MQYFEYRGHAYLNSIEKTKLMIVVRPDLRKIYETGNTFPPVGVSKSRFHWSRDCKPSAR